VDSSYFTDFSTFADVAFVDFEIACWDADQSALLRHRRTGLALGIYLPGQVSAFGHCLRSDPRSVCDPGPP